MTFEIVRSWSNGSVNYTSTQKLESKVAVHAHNRFLVTVCHRIAAFGSCLISAEIKDDTVRIESTTHGVEIWRFVEDED